MVIPAHNAAGHIHRCLERVFSQSYPHLEVIVVDDASTDATGDVVLSFGERVEYLRLERNRGPAYARTLGLSRSTGEFVAFLDADDYWMPDFLTTTVVFLSGNPTAIAVSTGFVSKRWDGSELPGPILEDADAAAFPASGAIIVDFFRFWGRYQHILTGTVLMRTAVARQTGGQREELRLTEDLEFWGYLATYGPWGFIPHALFMTDECAIGTRERLAKIKYRHLNFSTMSTDQWETRILSRILPEQTASFAVVVARIGVAIAIANAYSCSFRRAWDVARRFRNDLGSGLGRVLRLGLRCGPLLWPLFCLAIRVREYALAYFHGWRKRENPGFARSPNEHRLKKPRVVFITSALPKLSDRNMNYFQRAHFLGRHTELTVLARQGADYTTVVPEGTTVLAARWPGKAGQLAHCLLQCLKWRREDAVQVIITEPSILGICGYVAKMVTGCRWVVDVWDIPIRNVSGTNRMTDGYFSLIRLLMKQLYRRVDLFIVSIVPDMQLRFFAIPPEKILALVNAIWPAEALPAGSDERHDPFVILCMRSTHMADMGLDILANAFAIVKQTVPAMMLTIIGRIPKEVRHQVRSIEGMQGVRLIDFVEHDILMKMIGQASACVVPFKDVPDLAQTYPIKVLEYLASGKPVIASRIKGMTRVLRDGENGILFEAGDAEDLAEKILLVYRDGELRAKLSKHAASHDERFDCRVKNMRIVEAITGLVGT